MRVSLPERVVYGSLSAKPRIPLFVGDVFVRTVYRLRVASIATTVTYLQMLQRPETAPADRADVQLVRRTTMKSDEYLALYDRVGREYTWTARKLMAKSELTAILASAAVEIHVIEVSGEEAGYVELNCRVPGEVELDYFGLFPEFCGRGLGPYVLAWAIDRAWQKTITRMWLNTCTLDHPAALGTYKRAGFVVYDRREEQVETLPDEEPAGPASPSR